jgi:hypothetical protein
MWPSSSGIRTQGNSNTTAAMHATMKPTAPPTLNQSETTAARFKADGSSVSRRTASLTPEA